MGDDRARVAAGELAKGASLGRYVVLGLIGRGGMGEVYAAYDPELNRKIAIKLLSGRGIDDAAVSRGRQRLLREAQAIARLSHPNVVVVHDVGTIDGSVFIAMEYVDGHTLGHWSHAKTRSWREVRDVFMAAGRGLAAAHAAGLVHRDFKPDNVMLAKTGEVRVMDFGLARESVAADSAPAVVASTDEGSPVGGYLHVKVTQAGAISGTPAYMAPEQFIGAETDARTDQFSFAVAFWEALHGQRPFAGRNMIELMVSASSGTVREPPPNTSVPGWIRRILLRALRADRAERYPSMFEMLAALARDPAARRRRWFAVAAMLLLLGATAAGARRMGADRRAMCAAGPGRATTAWEPERRRAVERAFKASGNAAAARTFATTASLMEDYVGRWTRLYTETCEATHVRGEQSQEVLDLRMDCLAERLASLRALGEVLVSADARVVDNAVAAASQLPMLERCSDVPMLRAVVRPPDDPATRARVAALREDVAKVTALAASGQCKRASADGEKVVAAATALGYQPLIAEALLAVGWLGDSCTDPAKAVAQLEEASFAAELSHHDQVVIEAGHFLSGFYSDQLLDLPTARRWQRHAEVVLARFPGHPVLEAWLTTSRATYLRGSGQLAAAIEESRRALALLEKVRGPGHLDVAIGLQNLGATLMENGQYAEAEAPTVRSLAMMKTLFGNESVRTAAVSLNHGEILTALHRFDEARARLEQALSMFRKQDASGFYVGYALLDRGRLELEEGNAEKARATLLEARRTFGSAYPDLSAEADFAYARSSWAVPAERRNAVALTRRSRETLAAIKGKARKVAEIDAWLTAHAGDNRH